MKDREKSNITVTVPNLSGPLAQALESYNAKAKVKATKMETRGGDPGYVMTKKGTFLFCEEGVGDNKPITETNPAVIEIYPGTDKTFAMFPCGTISLTDAELIMLPTAREAQLEDFIRSFGHRLESNYYQWLQALRKAGPSVMSEA
jgi:hypothetical protein